MQSTDTLRQLALGLSYILPVYSWERAYARLLSNLESPIEIDRGLLEIRESLEGYEDEAEVTASSTALDILYKAGI